MKTIHNLDLTEFNSYRIHSVAETAFFPETAEEIVEIVNQKHPIVIGGGCNIIFSEERYSKPFMFLRENFAGIEKDGEHLHVKAGTDLKVLSEYALKNSLSGVENYYDIPGCVGGATIMNAGSGNSSFSDLVIRVTYYDIDKQSVETVIREDLHFEYRGNVFRNMNVVVLEVELALQKGEHAMIASLMENNKATRWAKQPRNYPSAGSVFKRPNGHYVGPMVTEVGLKGYQHNGAMVSDKHAGFIINRDNASGKDILELITIIQTKVYERFGVKLCLEQRII